MLTLTESQNNLVGLVNSHSHHNNENGQNPVSDSQGDITLAINAGMGDKLAFEELYKRHHRRVYSLCLRMLKNSHESEDLTQEVFIQLYRKLRSFRGDSAFTTWLHRLTVNQVLMHFRKRYLKAETLTEDGEFYETTASCDRSFTSFDDKIILEQAMKKLPKGYRNTFFLHDIMGYEHEEVAVILGYSVGTSKSQLHKARVKLYRLISRRANPRSDNPIFIDELDDRQVFVKEGFSIEDALKLADHAFAFEEE